MSLKLWEKPETVAVALGWPLPDQDQVDLGFFYNPSTGESEIRVESPKQPKFVIVNGLRYNPEVPVYPEKPVNFPGEL